MEAPPARYLTTSDGFNIAYAVSGSGRPIVFLPLTFSHVQIFWSGESNLRDWLNGLSARFRLIQYDGRGQGMSTRGLPANHGVAAELCDLETVVEALHLDEFALMARGPMGHTALRYAAAHPGRVEFLILFSLPASGTAWPATFASRLAEDDWDLFLQSFSAFDGQLADVGASIQRMSQTVTQPDWKVLIRHWMDSDVQDLLPRIKTPTLVVHPKAVLQPRPGESLNIARRLPNAQIVTTDGAFQLGDPDQGLAAIDLFLAGLESAASEAPAARPVSLSSREIEVLRLLAAGMSSREIGQSLTLSVRTVERHIGNIYSKTDTHNRVQATTYARTYHLL
jgi:DNA-binding CsgD family transcriptional regulator/pimeloyl-ACP methyl ester carboxylesterase